MNPRSEADLRRVHSLTVAFAIVALSGVASSDVHAQTTPGQARGLRYLSWSGRTESPTPIRDEAAPSPRADLRRLNRVIPHGGVAPQPQPRTGGSPPTGEGRRTLTPANAWMRPAAPPPAAPPPAPAPVSPPAIAPAVPEYLPDTGGRGQPVPAEVLRQDDPASAQPVAPPSDDPMAPRRDAPIFRMQQASPDAARVPTERQAEPQAEAPSASRAPRPRRIASVTPNPDDRPGQQGARYYSVHRQNGREPDALAIPRPTYVDALAVTVTETPASQDLAQPDPGPTLIRDANGRLRAQPAPPAGGDYE